MPRQDIVQTFGVSLGTIKRLVAKQRHGDTLVPRTPTGRPATISLAQDPPLQAQLAAHADATLAQQADLWNAAQGTTLRQGPLGRALRRWGWTRKKST